MTKEIDKQAWKVIELGNQEADYNSVERLYFKHDRSRLGSIIGVNLIICMLKKFDDWIDNFEDSIMDYYENK